jgi:drug/metabolite transporter (DMT)-like permease
MGNRTKLAFAFGYLLLCLIGALSFAITLGKVEEKTSYGLLILLGCYTTLSGAFAAWAFGIKHHNDGE